MFGSIKNFIRRHSRKFAVCGLIASSYIIISRYSHRKIIEWHKQEVQKRVLNSKRKQHYECTEKSCVQAIYNLGRCIKNSVLKYISSQEIIDKLKDGNCDKIACWNELKVNSICKSVIIIYADIMVVLIMQIQLNLISALMFVDSNKMEDERELRRIQENYLNLSNYFIDGGIKQLSLFIKQKVEQVLKSISLKDKFNLKELEQIYLGIMSSILADKNGDPVKNFRQYVFPPTINTENNNRYKEIINVTLDLLDGQEFHSLMQSNVRSGFVLMIDKISESFDKAVNKNSDNSSSMTEEVAENYLIVHNLENSKLPMAKIIPIVNNLFPDISEGNDIHDTWLKFLIANHQLKSFGANIYEAFSPYQ
ncbi:peroxisomal biogenesis factor 3 [Microplitis mediator]|uniref:peroxisomal biogenesis factor 3 n=1 Tax=Microplitis mediator TaxID=375433 RepID=UPI00255274F1|nr:peroxisomal biogenesis factor 3 [Microplitis mediator]